MQTGSRNPPDIGRCCAYKPRRVIPSARVHALDLHTRKRHAARHDKADVAEPSTTARLPGRHPCRFMRSCAEPAEYTPEGRVPARFNAPAPRSREPVAKTTARESIEMLARRVNRNDRMQPSGCARRINAQNGGLPQNLDTLSTYIDQLFSGELRTVSSCPNRCKPKPSWMHCFMTPPRFRSRSTRSTRAAPAIRARRAQPCRQRRHLPPRRRRLRARTRARRYLQQQQAHDNTHENRHRRDVEAPCNFRRHARYARRCAGSRRRQNPPWQRPIIAPVRHLTASTSAAGSGPWSASTISPSVTWQHRHTMRP